LESKLSLKGPITGRKMGCDLHTNHCSRFVQSNWTNFKSQTRQNLPSPTNSTYWMFKEIAFARLY